MFFVFINK